ncbi:MAG TPA: sigma-54-dependent Fis family transcriptional regulator [Polyangia bacterium]|jgi:DNA-binding NtrC family response regulator
MKSADLDLRDLLEFEPAKGGPIHFAGERVLLLDAVALGLLRRSLIDTMGLAGAKAMLARFGFAHGWRTAETLKALPWQSEDDWRRAGGRLHTLQGMVTVEPLPATNEPNAPFAEAIWRDSYEAEQHLLHVGRADEAVCWTLCGFASGYLSFANGREIFCLEESCVGKGDAVCRAVARDTAAWGERIEPYLALFRSTCTSEALKHVADQIKKTERKLRERRNARSADAGPESDETFGIITRSSEMKKTVDLARRSARVDTTVLITGPSGAGKERVARFIHAESPRAAGPFIAVNCAALTETLLESELFGHAKGAFTGATSDRVGLFEAANGGTLLLDEIGEVSAGMQAKLLRVLQEHEIRRVGESRNRKVDVRVLAATNRTLSEEVTRGAFRHDLYYRLRVIELRVPSLRERQCDIVPLTRRFLVEAAERLHRPVEGLTPAAADQLVRYDWPGNVRELENAVERAVALALGPRIDVEDLPEEVRRARSAVLPEGGGRRLADVERSLILTTLAQAGGNRAKAAELLGIGVATLYRKLKQYGEDGGEGQAGVAAPDAA